MTNSAFTNTEKLLAMAECVHRRKLAADFDAQLTDYFERKRRKLLKDIRE